MAWSAVVHRPSSRRIAIRNNQNLFHFLSTSTYSQYEYRNVCKFTVTPLCKRNSDNEINCYFGTHIQIQILKTIGNKKCLSRLLFGSDFKTAIDDDLTMSTETSNARKRKPTAEAPKVVVSSDDQSKSKSRRVSSNTPVVSATSTIASHQTTGYTGKPPP